MAFLPYHRIHQPDPTQSSLALDVRDLRVDRPDGNGIALQGVNLQVHPGARVALVGPNGAGKSTLLKAIVGLLPIRAGEIRVFGQPAATDRHRVAYLAQRSEIDWRFPMTVRRLTVTGRYVHLGWFRQPGPHDWALADEMLSRLGILKLAERQIGQLSGGQQQRTLLARALVQEADLLLLDEPLNAVDADTRNIIATVLTDLARQGKAVVVATHDLGRLESDFDAALYLCEGHVVPAPPGAFTRHEPPQPHDLPAAVPPGSHQPSLTSLATPAPTALSNGG
jgi:ABC-type Mn2+/Zn2+ transport system ATPase subunit